ncbi:MAG TPA: hypothetical protein VN799_00930, partial [Acidimicrobiales bacterium]|nr:hypothetical protein [Acidimicrobiales bacterium]
MTKNGNVPRHKRLYQPPLPWTTDGGPAPAPARRSTGTTRTPPTTRRNRIAAESRTQACGVPTPRRAVTYGEWRLDEKTRR